MRMTYRPLPMPGGAFCVLRRRNARRPAGFRLLDIAHLSDWEAEGGSLAPEPPVHRIR